VKQLRGRRFLGSIAMFIPRWRFLHDLFRSHPSVSDFILIRSVGLVSGALHKIELSRQLFPPPLRRIKGWGGRPHHLMDQPERSPHSPFFFFFQELGGGRSASLSPIVFFCLFLSRSACPSLFFSPEGELDDGVDLRLCFLRGKRVRCV